MPAIAPLASTAFNLVIAFFSGVLLSSVWQSSDLTLWTPSFQHNPTWYSFVPLPAKSVLGLPPPPDLTWEQPPKHTQWLYGEYCELIPHGDMDEALLENVSSIGHSDEYTSLLENLDPQDDLYVCAVPPELTRWQVFFSYFQRAFYKAFHLLSYILEHYYWLFWIIGFLTVLLFIHRSIVHKLLEKILQSVEMIDQLHKEFLSEQKAHLEVLEQHVSANEELENMRRALERSTAALEAMKTLSEEHKSTSEQERLQKDTEQKLAHERHEQSQKDADQKFEQERKKNARTQEQLTSALAKCKDLEKELDEERSQHTSQQSLLDSLRAQLKTAEAALLQQTPYEKTDLHRSQLKTIADLQDELAGFERQIREQVSKETIESTEALEKKAAGLSNSLRAEQLSHEQTQQQVYEQKKLYNTLEDRFKRLDEKSRQEDEEQKSSYKILEDQYKQLDQKTRQEMEGQKSSYKALENQYKQLDQKVQRQTKEQKNLYKTLEDQNKELDAQLRQARTERAELREELDDKNNKVQELDLSLADTQQDLATAQSRASRLDDLEAQLQMSRDEVAKLTQERYHSVNKITELTDEATSNGQALQNAQFRVSRISTLESNLAKSLETEFDLRGKVDSYKNVEKALESKVEELKRNIDTLTEQHSTETKKQQITLITITEERDRTQSDLNQNRKELSEMKVKYTQLVSEGQTSLAKVAELQSKSDAQAAELEQHRINIPKVLQERNDMVAQRNQAVHHLEKEREKFARLSIRTDEANPATNVEASPQTPTTVGSTAQASVHRRRRQQRHPLCDRCRDSKLMCDRKNPCSSCKVAGVSCTRLNVPSSVANDQSTESPSAVTVVSSESIENAVDSGITPTPASGSNIDQVRDSKEALPSEGPSDKDDSSASTSAQSSSSSDEPSQELQVQQSEPTDNEEPEQVAKASTLQQNIENAYSAAEPQETPALTEVPVTSNEGEVVSISDQSAMSDEQSSATVDEDKVNA